MLVEDSKKEQLEILNHHWPLAEDLFAKWGCYPNHENVVKVKDVHDIAPELSAWGIPWRLK